MNCHAKVISIKELTHDVKEIALQLINPPKISFKAGQYIAIEVTEMREGKARQNNRPYSIVSPPEEDRVIRVCVNLVAGGPGSTTLHRLRIGEELSFLHPFGYFTIKSEATSSLLFVATGTGIAPIRSMIEHLLHQGIERPMTLFWGLRSERDLYYQEDFEALSQKYPFLKIITSLSQPTSNWQGDKGRVTEQLSRKKITVENLEAYLCGNMAMIREVRTMLLDQGMTKRAIHFEKFY